MQIIRDGGKSFRVTVIVAEQTPGCVVLFAVGRGGNPLRHLPLLRSLAGRGCTIIAPHEDMLASSIPTKAELDARTRRLETAAAEFCKTDLPMVGIGHSIGTVALLALAGGEAQTFAGDPVMSGSRLKFDRLALFAPLSVFFRRPGALKSVRVPIGIWAGAKDSITPPAEAELLKAMLELQAPIEIRVDEEAGHFSYMDELPPNVSDSHPDRRTFLAKLADEVGEFVCATVRPGGRAGTLRGQ
jgi:pimeloyl-ACP methyl ester carboxylesterase